VKFKVGTQEMFATAIWDNNRLWQVPLAPIHRVYLPLVLNNQSDFPVDAGP
jgi:hypothetical protein